MDTDSGRFLREDDERVQSWMQRIEVGEIVKIKGEECRVESIGDRTITLGLLSRLERLSQELFGEKHLEDLRDLNRHERRRREREIRKGAK